MKQKKLPEKGKAAANDKLHAKEIVEYFKKGPFTGNFWL